MDRNLFLAVVLALGFSVSVSAQSALAAKTGSGSVSDAGPSWKRSYLSAGVSSATYDVDFALDSGAGASEIGMRGLICEFGVPVFSAPAEGSVGWSTFVSVSYSLHWEVEGDDFSFVPDRVGGEDTENNYLMHAGQIMATARIFVPLESPPHQFAVFAGIGPGLAYHGQWNKASSFALRLGGEYLFNSRYGLSLTWQRKGITYSTNDVVVSSESTFVLREFTLSLVARM